jgi:MFS family permease
MVLLFLPPLAFFTLAKWASLSDVFGRKALLQLALIAHSLSQLITWFAASPHNPVGYRLLYVDSILLGMTAGSSLIQPAITAYVGKYFNMDGPCNHLGNCRDLI